MQIPDWVQKVLTEFERRTKPHNEVEIADALDRARKAQGDLSEGDFKGYLAERSAFLFIEPPGKNSIWGTYFAPMVTFKRDGTEIYIPDPKDLGDDALRHWAVRAKSVLNPVMRARYADLVWDFEPLLTGNRRRHEYVCIAIDAYLNATEKGMYPMGIEGMHWLSRAWNLSLAIADKERQRNTVDSIFLMYDKVVSPRHAGVWVIPFDLLYEKSDLLSADQKTRLITDLETMLAKTSGNGKPEDFDPFGSQAAADRLAQHYKRQNDKANVERVIKTYGQAFEKMAGDASSVLASAWLQPVAERYEQEGLKQDAERLRNMVTERGKAVVDDLKQVSATAEIKQEDVEKLVNHLIGSGELKKSLRQVAYYFIPKANEAKQLMDLMRTNAPLLSMIPITLVDSEGRPTARIGSIDEDAEGRLHRQLAQTMSFYQGLLTYTLEILRQRYSPTVDDILEVLYESPLFAESRKPILHDGLVAYLQGDYLKAIHVLVPQVEQALRNLLVLIEVPTTRPVPRHPGISDVKGMNNILDDERARNVLTEDLWRYLAVLFVDRKAGINLRNDLAHGLLAHEIFNQHMADWVLHSLLALGLMQPTGKMPSVDREAD